MNLDDDAALDRAIDRLAAILERMQSRQARAEERLATLYQAVAIGFALVVVSLSFLVVILAYRVPEMTAAIVRMNDDFASVAGNMARMDRQVEEMRNHVGSLPDVVVHLDRIQFGVAGLRNDVAAMGETMVAMDLDLGVMETGISDLRQSFEVLEVTVARMGRDLDQIAAPARIFNQFNPFR